MQIGVPGGVNAVIVGSSPIGGLTSRRSPECREAGKPGSRDCESN